MNRNAKILLVRLALLAIASVFTQPAVALTPEERAFFGLTALQAAHPDLTGTGFSFAVSDTEFDLAHPALGWRTNETFAQWFATTNSIPALASRNPRILSAANRSRAAVSYTNRHHGAALYSFDLPSQNNNTLDGTIWGIHGTAVAGTAGSGTNGPNGDSLGVAPHARMVLASDTEDFGLAAGQVPDGNPLKTVAMNRSFTGASSLPPDVRANAGLITVNAAGNDFGNASMNRIAVYGLSPHLASIRWLLDKGYDIIASGLYSVSSNGCINAAYGAQHNPESIWTDFSVTTLSPDGHMDIGWSGTSFSAPFTVGGVTLIQQAYANTHSGRWLRVDQMNRILRKSARFMDDPFTGLRCHVASFDTAVALATNYPGDPSLEPNFATDFSATNRVNATGTDPVHPDPNYFRAEPAYGSGAFDFTAPTIDAGTLRFFGNNGPGRCNIALRNGWGDIAVANLAAGKTLTMSMAFDTNPGWVSGTTETYLGVKEMVGSDQFMDAGRETDSTPYGRLAFRITAYQGSDLCLVEALQCSQSPDTNDVLWLRPDPWNLPAWDVPLASIVVTNLTLGNMATVTVEFTAANMRFLRDGQQILVAGHTVPTFTLARSTPYLHLQHAQTDHLTRVRSFNVQTTSSAEPAVTLVSRRARALEGVAAFGPAAVGVLSVNRGLATNTPLTVHYTVSGSASNGVDFAPLSGAVTIPANAAETDLGILPLLDATLEPDETVVIQLAPGSGYTVGSAAPVTVTVVDASDADQDGIANTNEDRNANGNAADDDTDGDLLPDYIDADDDGDHASTAAEDRNGNGDPRDDDTDGDSTPDYLDVDDDGDGLTTLQEDRNRNGTPADDDYDQDGTPDYLDTDPAPYSDFATVAIAGTFNGWSTTAHEMTLVGNGQWQRDVYFTGAAGLELKFVANGTWDVNWGDDDPTNTLPRLDGTGEPYGSNLVVGGTLNGTYRFTFHDGTRAYAIAFVPPTDNDADGMPDDWELANGLNPNLPGDANGDPDGDGFTNSEEFQNGTDPHAWNPHLTSHASMTVAATFNGWDAGANNMVLVDDYTWRYVGTFLGASNVEFKFAANGSWTTNWGDADQSDFVVPLTNGLGEQGAANIVISGTLDGIYAFTFNETSRAYSVSETCDEFCPLVEGIGSIVSPGVPGPVMGFSPSWKAIAGGDDDTATPSALVLARRYGGGRIVAFGHDGLPQHLDDLDNRGFMVNVLDWLNDNGFKQVAYATGHGEWVQGAQLAALATEMTNHGYAFTELSGLITTSALAGSDVLIVGNAWAPLNYNESYELEAFVNGGGSVLLLGLGWSWNGTYYDDYPMNQIGERFQLRWLRNYITDPTHQTNGTAVFHTFYPRVPYFNFTDATAQVAMIHAEYPHALANALEVNDRLRRDYLVAQGALAAASRDLYLYGYERYALFEFCAGQASNYPNYFARTNTFNSATHPAMSRMRERFMRTWIDAQDLWTYSKDQVATIGGFDAGYSNLWQDFTVYLMDNHMLDDTQRLSIASCLDTVPAGMHDLRAISVTDFLGAGTPEVSLVGRFGQVNVFGLKVGAMAENPFPADVAARTSDVFAATVAHEVSHVVDSFTVNAASNLASRKSALLAAAGTNRFNYLRGGDGLPFGDGFFASNPQEFFASMANQWFTDSEHVFDLALARFTNGIPHPADQAVFVADVFSRGQNTLPLYAMRADGQFAVTTGRLFRAGDGALRALASPEATWFFAYDAFGAVTSFVRTDGTTDQDGDLVTDRWEIEYDFNPLDPSDATEDADRDGLTQRDEFVRGTHPYRADTDLDGQSDLFDAQPTVAAYPQLMTAPGTIGTATKSTYRWTVHYASYGYASWGAPNYSVSEGFARFDVAGIPDNAVIRNVAVTYQSSSYPYNWYSFAAPATEVAALGGQDLAATNAPETIFNAIAAGTLLEVRSGSNDFPFANWREGTVDWSDSVDADLAGRLGADTWSLAFRNGSNNQFYANISNLTLVVSYETNGPYVSSYNTMTMAGTLNGWNPAANNMVLVSNHTWRFEREVRNASGIQLKFAANRAWDVNWGDDDQGDLDPALTGACESAGANIALNGTVDGTLRVTFNEATGAYTVEVLPRPDTDGDGMPDEWETAYGLNIASNDASANPDGDLFMNLQEYQNGTHPFVWNPPNSDYTAMTVAGTFNGWNTQATNMVLVSNYLWQFDLPVTNMASLQCKFTANASWDVNWGDNDQGPLVPPIAGTAERDGANIQVNGPVDGVLRFLFRESSAEYTIERIPPADTDGDGMPDYWEDVYGLDGNSPADAAEDADDDGFDNLAEYARRTNPRVPDAMFSNFTNLSVAGSFNGWNAGANNMRLVDHYTWQFTTGVDEPAGVEFKFAAEGGWSINWGETNQASPFTEPLQGVAETSGANIVAGGPLNGTYVFQFNELTREYRVSRSPVADFDQDGMPDDWESTHGFDARNGADAGADTDGDLLTNAEEYRHVTDPNDADTDDDGASDLDEVVAGTKPADAGSCFEAEPGRTGAVMRLSWPGAAGRMYDVMARASLVSGEWAFVEGRTNIAGRSETMSVEIAASNDAPAYLMIRVRKTSR
jgi:hypothetical protein